jgi:hypothetical protein
MNLTFVLPALLVAQDPAPPGLALVQLRNGGELAGTIELDTRDYVELRLPGGMVVGFERSRIGRIVPPAAPAEPPQAAPALAPRDEWFVLQDADGGAAGSLHCTVTAGDGGTVRVGEEWRFTRPGGDVEVTRLETVGPALQPLHCFYHERMRNGGGHVVAERLVRASVNEAGLAIERRTMSGAHRRQLPVRGELLFPLSWRERLLQRPGERRAQEAWIYDAADDELARWTLGAERRRRVPLADKAVAVSELVFQNAAGSCAEWVDATARVLRREVNGADLVAWPASERHARSGLLPEAAAVRVTEPEGAFALRLPNPVWRAAEPARAGQAGALAPLHGASATLVRLDHLQGGLALPGVADAVERWLALAKPDLDVQAREPGTVRGRESLALHARYSQDGVAHRCLVHVFAGPRGPMSLCLAAPAREWDVLAADFARLVDGVALDPQDLAPRAQGPLADQAVGRRRS